MALVLFLMLYLLPSLLLQNILKYNFDAKTGFSFCCPSTL